MFRRRDGCLLVLSQLVGGAVAEVAMHGGLGGLTSIVFMF